jgi:hypothetical protein
MKNSRSLDSSAVFSSCGNYRYLLTRQVAPGDRIATFIMLNPSTAGAVRDDPTIRRCVGMVRRWGYSRLVVANLFAIRATDPADIRKARDPVGPDNREWVIKAVNRAVASPNPADRAPVICAWGSHGSYMGQDRMVLGWIANICAPLALGFTRNGHPKHPLYVAYATELVELSSKRRAAPVAIVLH